MDLGSISLRARERGLLIGGTSTGKSTLGEGLITDFHHRYARAGGRVLILDSKPRFRAAYRPSGRRADRLYRHWDHGSTVPDSVVVSDPDELEVAHGTGARIVIAQAHSSAEIPQLVACAQAFFERSRGGKPRLLFVDETMDFFRSNGTPIGGTDTIVRSARAGRERGLACLFCSQRTRSIPAQLMEELTKLYLFRLDYRDDAKRLQEMGAPADMTPPEVEHVFRYWTKAAYGKVWGPYRLELPRRASAAS
jgi:hypothetical protein